MIEEFKGREQEKEGLLKKLKAKDEQIKSLQGQLERAQNK